jgi:perosamine synthetase
MREFIPIARPVLGDTEAKAVLDVLNSGMLTQGTEVKKFEDDFSHFLGVQNSIAVSNGTVALDLALKALDLQPGDEVVSPAFTFIATANAILYQGARPIFADVDSKTFNIDPQDLQNKVTSKTKAVIGVHLYGQPFDVQAVQQICDDHKIALIEDCAQAHGAEFEGQRVGSFGLGCFSFYPTKNMTTGEGGMITTNNDQLAAKLRLMRNHGDAGKYNHIILGYNYRMTNINGAIGQVQLRSLNQFNQKRIDNAEFLNKNLRRTGLTTPYKDARIKHVYNQYVIRVEESFPTSRENLMKYLESNGIGCAIHYPMPVYRQPLYRQLGMDRQNCPVSEDVSQRVLSLPVHPMLGQDDLTYIAKVVNSFEA